MNLNVWQHFEEWLNIEGNQDHVDEEMNPGCNDIVNVAISGLMRDPMCKN